MPDCYRSTQTGIRLYLRVTPNAGMDRVEGQENRDDGSAVLRLRVKAVPDKGRANAAVIALLAKKMRLPKRDFTLVAGDTARLKTIDIAGEPDALAALLAPLMA